MNNIINWTKFIFAITHFFSESGKIRGWIRYQIQLLIENCCNYLRIRLFYWNYEWLDFWNKPQNLSIHKKSKILVKFSIKFHFVRTCLKNWIHIQINFNFHFFFFEEKKKIDRIAITTHRYLTYIRLIGQISQSSACFLHLWWKID